MSEGPYQAHCVQCGSIIDLRKQRFYRRGTGWFKKQKNSQGTNSALMVEWLNEFVCQFCMDKKKHGMSWEQEPLFEMPYGE